MYDKLSFVILQMIMISNAYAQEIGYIIMLKHPKCSIIYPNKNIYLYIF